MTIMKTMRHNFKHLKYLIWVIIAVFIIGFAFSFGGGSKAKNAAAPAVVNGEAIPEREFLRAVQGQQDALHERYGAEVPRAELMKARRDVLDAFIQQEVALQGATALGLTVSDGELQQALQSLPDFRGQDGTFNMAAYVQFLNRQAQDGNTQAMVEENFRQRLLMSKLRDSFRNNAQVAGPELQAAMAKASRKVKPRGVVLLYKPLEAKITLAEDKVRDYYSQQRKSWEKPEQVKASHILIKGDGPGGDEAAKKKAEDLAKQAKGGADFAKLAKANSQDPGSGQRGGDLGLFGRGQMVPEFEKVAFSLKPGEVSDPVKSQFGWHVIKLVKKEAAFVPTWENSKKKATDELRASQARDLARKTAGQLQDKITAGAALDEAAKALGLSVKDGNWVGRDDKKVFAELGDTPGLARTLTDLDKGGVMARAQDTEKGSVLAEVADDKPGSLPEGDKLKALRVDVEGSLREAKGNALFDGWILSRKAQAKITDRMKEYYGEN